MIVSRSGSMCRILTGPLVTSFEELPCDDFGRYRDTSRVPRIAPSAEMLLEFMAHFSKRL